MHNRQGAGAQTTGEGPGLSADVRDEINDWAALPMRGGAESLNVSVAGGIALMPWLGIDINILSVFAFIMALGILVDDAIVTGENIYTHQLATPREPMDAAIRGTQEVTVPVIFGVLTTVAAFAPFALIEGDAQFMAKAMGGIMSVTGAPDGEPQRIGVAFADILTGLYSTIATI